MLGRVRLRVECSWVPIAAGGRRFDVSRTFVGTEDQVLVETEGLRPYRVCTR